MKLTYETKYDVGNAVYQILNYQTGISIRARKIVRVIGVVQTKDGSAIKYELDSLSPYNKYSFMNEVTESRLYASLEEAEAAAEIKVKDYRKRMLEQYEKELKDLESRKADEIERAIANIEEDYTNDTTWINEQIAKYSKKIK